MKTRKLLATIITMTLGIGAITFSAVKNQAKRLEEAGAITNYTPAMNINANVETRYAFEDDNPDKWGLSPAHAAFHYSNLLTTNTSKYAIAGGGSNQIRIYETEANKKCAAIYYPIAFYIMNPEPYSEITFNLTVNLSLQGGKSANYASMFFYGFGSYEDSYARTATPLDRLLIPKDQSEFDSYSVSNLCAKVGNNTDTTPTTASGTITGIKIKNNSNSSNPLCCYVGGIFIGARKDSSSNHQVTACITSSISGEKVDLVAKTSSGNNYTSFSQAINDVTNGGSITLLNNVTLSATQSISKNITFNMSGHNINTNGYNLQIINTGLNVSFTGTGTIYGNKTNGAIIITKGELTIGSAINIRNNATGYSTAVGVSIEGGSGKLNTSGSIEAEGAAVEVVSGSAYISGGSLRSVKTNTIKITSGNVCFSGSPTLTFDSSFASAHIYVSNLNNGKVYGTISSTYYTGSTLKIDAGTLPSLNTVCVYSASNNTRFTFVKNPGTGYEFKYDGSTHNISYVAQVREISFSTTNCSVQYTGNTITYGGEDYTATIVPNAGAVLPTTINVRLNDGTNATFLTVDEYYTYNSTTGVIVIRADKEYEYSLTVICTASLEHYQITYDGNGADSGTVTDNVTYSYGNKTYVKPNGYVYTYHTFVGWNTDKDATTALYSENEQFTVTGNITLYAIWTQTIEDKADYFIDTYMHMSEDVTGQCVEYYGPAKAAFNALEKAVRDFIIDNIYNVEARLVAWAAANGDVLNSTDNTLSTAQAQHRETLINSESSDMALLIVTLSALSLLTLLVFLKKKHN